jgi:hypothetical protein
MFGALGPRLASDLGTMSENTPAQNLLVKLTRELFQTETSASRHCRREAERLGHAAGADAFRDIARHADGILEQLPGLMRAEGLPQSPGGSFVGATFSQIRDKVADKMLDRERSYRGTILGMRHGVDVVRLFGTVGERNGRGSLAAFRDKWLAARIPLLQRVEDGLLWFADHPDVALERATMSRERTGARRSTKADAT